MSSTGNFPQPEARKAGSRLRAQRIPNPNPQLFEDTSMQQPVYGSYPPAHMEYDASIPGPYSQPEAYSQSVGSYGVQPSSEPGLAFPGQHLLSDPVANMAMQYSQQLAGQGSDFVHKNIEKVVTTSKLKYYFAVDTAYVGKKLGLLMFPFAHSDWSMKFNPEEPVAPRYDTNAPDLYIPVMSFVTYVLLAGITLGTQSRFSPEHLGITASTALIWTTIEILALLFSMYILNIASSMKLLDILAYCGYKFVGMIIILFASLAFQSTGYYIALGWMSLSIDFFLVRSLRVAIMTQNDPDSFGYGNKRKLYMLLVVALAQPVLMWWLTRRLAVGYE